MKCTIHAPEPNILQDASPGDLFLVRESREHECVFALLDPSAPLRSFYSNTVTLIKVVALACRVDEGELGYHKPGTALMLPPDTAIQFVEQLAPAKFGPGKSKDQVILEDLNEAIRARNARKVEPSFGPVAQTFLDEARNSKPGDRM